MALIFHFECTLKCCLQFGFNLDQSKNLSSGYGRKVFVNDFSFAGQVASTICGPCLNDTDCSDPNSECVGDGNSTVCKCLPTHHLNSCGVCTEGNLNFVFT